VKHDAHPPVGWVDVTHHVGELTAVDRPVVVDPAAARIQVRAGVAVLGGNEDEIPDGSDLHPLRVLSEVPIEFVLGNHQTTEPLETAAAKAVGATAAWVRAESCQG